jgi:hypothetical protein
MLEQIKKKSLNELKDLMGGFSQDAAGNNSQDNASGDEIGASVTGDSDDHSQSRSASTSKSIMATFARRPVNDGGRESVFNESVSTFITISNGSSFVPSLV